MFTATETNNIRNSIYKYKLCYFINLYFKLELAW